MPEKARYATAHRIRFQEVTTPEMLLLSDCPAGALSWKIGPSGPVGPDGYRLPGDVWCAVGLYREFNDAQRALQATQEFMPFVRNAIESWHALLLPVMHRGESNHLDRDCPGTLFEVGKSDPGGACMVITTAGFQFGPELKIERVVDFRRNVDLTNEWIGKADGCLAGQVFTPHTYGDDGFTMSIWRDDTSMLAAAYRPGLHRSQIDRHKAENVFDRSSFTRFRVLDACGQWSGRNPVADFAPHSQG
jgi:hypothetical protein